MADEDWTFETSFDAPLTLASQPAVDLVLECVDTVAFVSLNGSPLAALANAHRPHVLRLPPVRLVAGHNALKVEIRAAPAAAREAAERYPYEVGG